VFVKRILVLGVLALLLVSCSNSTSVAKTTTVITVAKTTTLLGNPPTTSNIVTTVVSTSTTLLGSPPTTVVTGTVIPTQATVLYIILNPQLPDALAKGSTLQMTALGQFSDGTRVDITNQATWSSSNTAVATVSKIGLVKGIDTGGTNISASFEGTSSNPPITVYVK
jgi:trimeric autotransporter adhesin